MPTAFFRSWLVDAALLDPERASAARLSYTGKNEAPYNVCSLFQKVSFNPRCGRDLRHGALYCGQFYRFATPEGLAAFLAPQARAPGGPPASWHGIASWVALPSL